jgi:integrase
MTTLSKRLAEYLSLRRSLGFDLAFEERVLRVFTAFADRQAIDHITVDLFLRWKATYGHANNSTWAHRLGMVRGFAKWLTGYDERTEVPPPGLVPAKWRRPKPYIYSREEVATIVSRAAQLPSRYGLRGWTYSTLFGLIAVTGLRINEALRLDDDDIDLGAGVITIKRGKNRRARFVPIVPSTTRRLAAYRAERVRLLGLGAGAFFQNDDGRRPTDYCARYNFAVVSQDIGLRQAQRFCRHGRGPRIHDLRHTFAVHTIMDWYRNGLDPDREMLRLSTYLGHVKPDHTYWYIEAVPELLELASKRAERSLALGTSRKGGVQ